MLCSHLTSAFASTSPSKFNIASKVMQTQTLRMGLNPFSVLAFGLLLTQCFTLILMIKQTSSVNSPLQLVTTEILKTSGIILMLISVENSFLDSSIILFLQKGQQDDLFSDFR